MPLTGTACALRDFAHAQNHPSDRRPHANVNTPRRLPAATAVIPSQHSFSRFVLVIDGLLLIVVLWFVFFVVTCNGIYLMSGRSPASPENRAVVLRIESLRVSPLRASIPRPESKAQLQEA
ncbi:hypothetical protein QJC38_004609 [Salmonella enterica]|nr:hypothetical protein [Salmonella enterica]